MVRDEMQLPDDPNELAALVMDDSQPPEVVNRAWEKLMPLIMQIARRAASKGKLLFGTIEEFVQECPGTVYILLREKKPYDPSKKTFNVWLERVLFRKAVDRIRTAARSRQISVSNLTSSGVIDDADDNHGERFHRMLDTPDPSEFSQEGGGRGEQNLRLLETLASLSNCIRNGLDKASTPASRRINYHAAFLLLLRVNALNMLASEVNSGDPFQQSEELVVWYEEETNLCIDPELKSIGEIWKELTAKRIYEINLCQLKECLRTNDRKEVKYNNLAMWFHRARNRAQKAIGEELWRKCGFERLTSFRKADQS